MNKFDEAKLIDLCNDHTLQIEQYFLDAQAMPTEEVK